LSGAGRGKDAFFKAEVFRCRRADGARVKDDPLVAEGVVGHEISLYGLVKAQSLVSETIPLVAFARLRS
jgi:hypothetical protein